MLLTIHQLVTAWQIVAKRSLASWRLLMAVTLGVLLAASIMSGTVIYYDSLRNLALQQIMLRRTPSELDIRLRAEHGPVTRSEYNSIVSLVDESIERHLGWLTDRSLVAGKTPTFFLTRPGEEPQTGGDVRRATFAFIPGLEDSVEIQPGGVWPSDTGGRSGADVVVQAIVPIEAAEQYDIDVGDVLVATPFWKDDVASISVRVTGVFERGQNISDIWTLEDQVIRPPPGSRFPAIGIYVSQDTFLDVLGPAFRRMNGTYAWLFSTDPDRIDARNAESALVNLRSANRMLTTGSVSFVLTTSLDNTLEEFRTRIFFGRVPMVVVLVLIVLVVLYYIVTLSSLVVEQRRSELALLRSRGASFTQLLAVFVLEGVTLSALCTLAGPLLAVTTVRFLGHAPAFSDLSGGEQMAAILTPQAFLLSGIGGLLGLVALVWPAVQASKADPTRQRQEVGRPTNRLVLQKYHLDILLLVIAILLLRQLSEQGSVLATDLLGETAASQMLLAVPGLTLLASAMVVLRLLPLVIRLLEWPLARRLPAGAALGVWQVARQPAHYSRLSLLLILTAGLGLLASSFGATLERSFVERVLMFTGGDFRINGVSTKYRNQPSLLVADYERMPGVVQATPLLRSSGLDTSKNFGGRFTLLAVDVDTFTEVAWFREDFTDAKPSNLLRELRLSKTTRGVELPIDAETVTITLKPDRSHPKVDVFVRLVDRRGFSTRKIRLGALESADWVEMRADLRLDESDRFAPPPPLIVLSIGIERSDGAQSIDAGSVLLGEIKVTTESGRTDVLESFDSLSGWYALRPLPDGVTDVVRVSEEPGMRDDGSAIEFKWTAGIPVIGRGIIFNELPTTARLPVVATETFIRAAGYRVGDEFEVSIGGNMKPARLTGIVEMFPTVTDPAEKLVVADLFSLDRVVDVSNLGGVSDFPTLGRFDAYVNIAAMMARPGPNEVWLSTSTTPPQLNILRERLSGPASYAAIDRAKMLEESQVDPLVEAGWKALLFVAFSVVLLLSGLGMVVHAYASLRARQGQLALLRTVGLSMRQIVAMVWLEQAIIVVSGLVLGTWMGHRLGATIMPFFGHDDFGRRVMPPFVLEVDWPALTVTYAVMVLLFVVVVGALAVLARRLSLADIMRSGEW